MICIIKVDLNWNHIFTKWCATNREKVKNHLETHLHEPQLIVAVKEPAHNHWQCSTRTYDHLAHWNCPDLTQPSQKKLNLYPGFPSKHPDECTLASLLHVGGNMFKVPMRADRFVTTILSSQVTPRIKKKMYLCSRENVAGPLTHISISLSES